MSQEDKYQETLVVKLIYSINNLEKLKTINESLNNYLITDEGYTGDILRIFGEYFIKHNKNKFKIIYENKKLELKDILDNDKILNREEPIKLKLIGIDNITNMSHMFNGCFHLSSFHIFYNNKDINNMIPPNDITSVNNNKNEYLNEEKF